MSEGKKESKTYDLRKMEDLFECVEIVTMARGALYPVDARLAARLEKVSDALSAFSMNMDLEPFEAESEPKSSGTEAGKGSDEQYSEQDPFDLLSDFPVSGGGGTTGKSPPSSKKTDSEEDDGIIDIVTGEKIK